MRIIEKLSGNIRKYNGGSILVLKKTTNLNEDITKQCESLVYTYEIKKCRKPF